MRLLVVGAGLIGSSVALAANHAGWTVRIQDVDEPSTTKAAELTRLAAMEEDFRPEVVCVAVPPASAALEIVAALRQYPQATVIDVASVKAELAQEVYAFGAISDRYLPTHPMAGKELSGPAAAAYDLFIDRLWIVCPNPKASEQDRDRVSSLISVCGALEFSLAPEVHDEVVAKTSHAPQVLSSVLAGLIGQLDEKQVTVSGQGLRDMTRLAGSNVELWSEILQANRRPVAAALRETAERLVEVAEGLEVEDGKAIREMLERGRVGKSQIPGKHGAPRMAFSTVSIVIDDAPGQLARIFATADQAQVNVEDVRIDHALGRQAAIVELDVLPEVEPVLAAALVQAGWQLRQGSTGNAQ